MSVKVAVRVRPFNSKEQGHELIVEMNGPQTILNYDGKERPFTFDYSFWSHDEFVEQENGYLSSGEGGKYADQQLVFNTLGKEVLDNAWQGYHCCLFAYGQTGAGKSYSMIGYGVNKGIVPIAADEIFKRISLPPQDGKTIEYEVCISMIEIYNEKIQDLLIPIDNRPQSGLKVRESKRVGVYVEGLKKVPVKSYDEIEEVMDIGSTHRTIGATEMNATSSRAHTIIIIDFTQTEFLDKKKVEKNSVINLVDLAGSEKVSKTHAQGDRLKEGCSINKSLTNLGIVISTLAENSSSKVKKMVPYRNSALTRILQNALGGNSKTIMICAVSPSHKSFEETLSTLRYADQAKKIKNTAIVNESETDKLIRNLKEENEQLKQMLEQLQASLPGNAGSSNSIQENEHKQKEAEETEKQLKTLARTLLENQKVMNKAEGQEDDNDVINIKDLKKENKNEVSETKKDFSIPHIVNINEDPMLSGNIYHSLTNGRRIKIGKKSSQPDIVLNSVGIMVEHALFSTEEDGVYLEPLSESASPFIRLNGEIVVQRKKLAHLDRVVFGASSIFLFRNPNESGNVHILEKEIDFEYCQREITKVEEMILQNENLKLEVSERLKENEKREMQSQLAHVFHMVAEINLTAEELHRLITMSTFFEYSYYTDNERRASAEGKSRLRPKILVDNKEQGYSYVWDLDCFTNRYYMIKDQLDTFYNTKVLPAVEEATDPFWDPKEQILLGKSFCSLMTVAFKFKFTKTLKILGDNDVVGSIEVELIPCDEVGKELDLANLQDDDILEDPLDLLGKRLDFILKIKQAILPESLCISPLVKYTFFEEEHKTCVIVGDVPTVEFDYSKHLTIEKIGKKELDYIKDGCLVLKICALEKTRERIDFAEYHGISNKNLDSQKREESSKLIAQAVKINTREKRPSVKDSKDCILI